jgi:hypothetical protein
MRYFQHHRRARRGGISSMNQERAPRPEFKFHAPARREPNHVDIWFENGVAFAAKLGKQLLLTLIASLFRAGADWLLKSGDQQTKDTLMNNMKTGPENNLYNNRTSTTNSTYENRDYNPNYNRYRGNGSETFPGFHN